MQFEWKNCEGSEMQLKTCDEILFVSELQRLFESCSEKSLRKKLRFIFNLHLLSIFFTQLNVSQFHKSNNLDQNWRQFINLNKLELCDLMENVESSPLKLVLEYLNNSFPGFVKRCPITVSLNCDFLFLKILSLINY
jgi:hypothetical protein